MPVSRTKRLAKSSLFGVLAQLVIFASSLFVRRIFVDQLGFQQLGLQSVLLSIIGTLSLAELGIGMAIGYSLYKPLSENNTAKVAALIRLFRKIYAIIAGVVLAIGLLLLPLLPTITQREFAFNDIWGIYLIFLMSSALSYLFSFNHVLLNADQRNYVLSIFSIFSRILTAGLQMLALFFLKNLLSYIIASVIVTLLSNIVITFYVRKKYPYLQKNVEKLRKEDAKEVKTKALALVFHKVGNYLVNGIDNILISAFISVTVVGYFNNYTTISTMITAVIAGVSSGVISGLGNFVATENKDRTAQVFANTRFVYFGLYAVIFSGIFVMSNQFLSLWLGSSEAVLSLEFLVVWSINIFIVGYSSALGDMRFAAGLFEPDKYFHILLPFINLGLSILLVRYIGITGIMLGTTCCLILKELIVLPHISFKYIFKDKKRKYYLRMALDFSVVAAITAVSYFINSAIKLNNAIANFVLGCLVCMGVSATVLFTVYFKTSEMKYLLNTIKRIFRRKNNENNPNIA